MQAAQDDFNKGIVMMPEMGEGYLNRGAAFIGQKRFSEALEDLNKGLALGVSRPEIGYYDRAIANEALGNVKAAYDDYNQALKMKADFGPAFDNRCWARAVVGILKPALADCNEAFRLMPGNLGTLSSRGFIFLKMTQFDAAVSDYDAALKLEPKLPFALYGRGLARLKNEDAAGESDIARWIATATTGER